MSTGTTYKITTVYKSIKVTKILDYIPTDQQIKSMRIEQLEQAKKELKVKKYDLIINIINEVE